MRRGALRCRRVLTRQPGRGLLTPCCPSCVGSISLAVLVFGVSAKCLDAVGDVTFEPSLLRLAGLLEPLETFYLCRCEYLLVFEAGEAMRDALALVGRRWGGRPGS